MLLDAADLAAAMSVEALLGTDRVFAADLQALRPQAGQAVSAARIAAALAGSAIVASHAGGRTPGCRTPTRCAARRRCTAPPGTPSSTRAGSPTRELASSIDNPVVLPDGRVESNGNFHGAPVAAVLDFLAISVADVAGIAERRTDRMLDASRSHGLPPFLAYEVGVDSGHMIAQYTQAGIVSELKRLAVPGVRGLDPVIGDAGGPRLDGLARRGASCAAPSTGCAGSSPSRSSPRQGHWTSGRRCIPAR